MVANNDPNEKTESYEDQIEEEENDEEDSPIVFDDPDVQMVDFKDDGRAVVIDNGYKDEPEKLNDIEKITSATMSATMNHEA